MVKKPSCGFTLCTQPSIATPLLDLIPFPLCALHLSTLYPTPPLTHASPQVPDQLQVAVSQVILLDQPEAAIPTLRLLPEAEHWLAVALLLTHQYREAESLLKVAASADSALRTRNLLAWTLYKQGAKEHSELQLLRNLADVSPESELEAETHLFLASVSKTPAYAERAFAYYNEHPDQPCEDFLQTAYLVLLSQTLGRWTGIQLRAATSPLGALVTRLFNAFHKQGSSDSLTAIRAFHGEQTPAFARELHLFACIHEYDSFIASNALKQALDIALSTNSCAPYRYTDWVTLVYDEWPEAETYLRRLADSTGKSSALVRFYLMKSRTADAVSIVKARIAESQLSEELEDLARFCYSEVPLHSLAVSLYADLLARYTATSSPAQAEAHFRLGSLAHATENYPEAAKHLSSALALYQAQDQLSAAVCWKALGECLRAQGQLESATSAFTSAVNLFKSFHSSAKFTASAISELAEVAEDVWPEYLRTLREANNPIALARALEMSLKAQPSESGLQELKQLYADTVNSRIGQNNALNALAKVYASAEKQAEVIQTYTEMLRLAKSSKGYAQLLKNVEKMTSREWKSGYLREEVECARRGSSSEELATALIEFAEHLNATYLQTQDTDLLEEAETLIEEAFPLIRASNSLLSARLLQRVSHMINQHTANEEIEWEALQKMALADGPLRFHVLGNCWLQKGDLSGAEVCLMAEEGEGEMTVSRLSRGMKLVYK